MTGDSFLVKALKANPLQIKCSLSDHLALPAPVSVVFFYRKAIPKELIIEALQSVLVDFPLFASRFIKNGKGLALDCQNQGVYVKVVHRDSTLFACFPSIQQLDMTQFVDAVKPFKDLKRQEPVLNIQLNYYQDGLAIGYCWHHSLGDMATFMEFLKALSACAQGKSYLLPQLVTDRALYFEKKLEHIPLCKKEKALRLKVLGMLDLLRLIKHVYSKRESIYLYFTQEEVCALKERLSHQTGLKLSRNDALCAHLLELTARYRSHPGLYLSLAVNMRARLNLPSNLLGNYSDLISIPIENPGQVENGAKAIHEAVRNYLSDYFQHPLIMQEWVNAHNGIEKIRRLIPESLLPELNHLLITNWTHFGVYSIDFGIASPCLFLPIGRTPLPWASCIVEGFDNQGLLATLVLPAAIAKQLRMVY